MKNQYNYLKIQNYLNSENIDVHNDERKLIFHLRSQMLYKMKTHFRNMYEETICEGCKVDESTAKHTLQCSKLIVKNELVTYLPQYDYIYGEDEGEQVYMVRNHQDGYPYINLAFFFFFENIQRPQFIW